MHLEYGATLAQSMLPGLVQVFGIIAIGYVFGRTGILPGDAAKGICIFLQNLALPNLIFTSLATISFANVEWKFIAAVLVAKASVFILVSIVTMLLTRPTHLGKSGLYAIAATQSNDLALGYPLIFSLYKDHHSDYASLLYVVVPIQLLILNPIGILMMEANKCANSRENSRGHPCIVIAKSIFTNPIIVMTMLGIVWNFAFYHKIPLVIGQLLDAIGSVFSTVALFILGHSMSGRFRSIGGSFTFSPGLIVLAKILFLPILLQRLVSFFLSGSEEAGDLSNLGFLYGTIPCAPSAFIFSKQYQISVDVITSATVYSTLFSAPLMMTSAAVISAAQHGLKNVSYYITETITYAGVLNLLSCFWLLFTCVMHRRWKDICFLGTIYLIVAQTVLSAGAISLFFDTGNLYVFYAHYVLSSVGLYLTYIFTLFLAFLIFLLQWRSLCYVLRHRMLLCVCGFVMPVFVSTVLTTCLIWGGKKLSHPVFPFGRAQVSALLVLSSVCLVATIVFLIFQHRHMKMARSRVHSETVEQSSIEPSHSHGENDALLKTCATGSDSAVGGCCCSDVTPGSSTEGPPSLDIEDLGSKLPSPPKSSSYGAVMPINRVYDCFCDTNHTCSATQRLWCASEIWTYQQHSQCDEVDLNTGNHFIKYIILLLSLCSSMAVSITVCISSLVMEEMGGVLIELQFLDVILQNSQGVICLFLFGYDSMIFEIIYRAFQRVRNCLSNDI